LNHADLGITYGGKLKVPFGLTGFPMHFVASKGLYCFHDSSWGTRPRPYAGHAVMRANAAIHWRARSLKIVADSSMHAETAEASACTKDAMFVRMVLTGIKRAVVGPTVLLGDNSAMYDMVSKEGTSSKSRHFERATIFVKYALMRLFIACLLISTQYMAADIFTKATDEATFLTMRAVLRNEKSKSFGMRVTRVLRTLKHLVTPA
jgi:hypothetical protein